jgi:uncharacterized membrane protein YfcA
MFLEVATVMGALGGAFVANLISIKSLTLVLAIVLFYSAYLSQQAKPDQFLDEDAQFLLNPLKLHGTCPTPEGLKTYQVNSFGAGFGIMTIAGFLSGLLGIGSGAFKVLAMDRVMGLPFKVSTTTSNFTIGVTAAASAGIYLARGYIDPMLTMPVMLGVLLGAFLGTKVLIGAETTILRRVFSIVLVMMAFRMVYTIFMAE